MTVLHLWATSRYRQFEALTEMLSVKPIQGKIKIKRVTVHQRRPLNTGLFFNIHQVCLSKKKVPQIHMIVIDDWDFTDGASPEITFKILQNITSALTKFEGIHVVCVDFISRMEFNDELNFQTRIGSFKSKAEQLSRNNPSHFHYFDNEDYLDFSHCDDGTPLTEHELDAATTHFYSNLEQVIEELEQI